MAGDGGEGRNRRDGARMATAGAGEDRDDSGECGPPSTGWLPREEEEAEVVRRDTSGELGAAQDGGDLRGNAAVAAGARLGFHGGERKREQGEREEREARQQGDLLHHEAGQRGGGRQLGSKGTTRRPWRGSVATVAHSEDGNFADNPLGPFFLLNFLETF